MVAVDLDYNHAFCIQSLDDLCNPSSFRRMSYACMGFQGRPSILSEAWTMAASQVLSYVFLAALVSGSVSITSCFGIVLFRASHSTCSPTDKIFFIGDAQSI
jgi:hypothetical protein